MRVAVLSSTKGHSFKVMSEGFEGERRLILALAPMQASKGGHRVTLLKNWPLDIASILFRLGCSLRSLLDFIFVPLPPIVPLSPSLPFLGNRWFLIGLAAPQV